MYLFLFQVLNPNLNLKVKVERLDFGWTPININKIWLLLFKEMRYKKENEGFVVQCVLYK